MNDQLDLERVLRAHLAERGDNRPAEGALEAVLAVTAGIRPRRSWRSWTLASVAPNLTFEQGARLTGRLLWVLVLLGLLVALAIGVTTIGSPRPRPVIVVKPSPPASSLVTVNYHNGPITIANASGVMALDPLTGAQSTIATSPAEYADWAPDGRGLATVNGSQLFVTNTTTGATAQLTAGLTIRSPIAWSPDGNRVAYLDLDGVHLVEVASGADSHLPAYPGSLDGASDTYDQIFHERPSWTPHGKAVTYTRQGQIYMSYVDGSQAEALPVPANFQWGLAWSPDGRKVAYFDDPLWAQAPTGGDPGVMQLWVANADGTQQTKLFEQPACCLAIDPSGPIWSPDGTEIAIGLGSFGLEVVDVATPVARNFGTSPLGDVGWRPVR